MDTVLQNSNPDNQQLTSSTVSNMAGLLQYIPNVFSKDECDAIIKIAEDTGFIQASFYTDSSGNQHYSSVRKSYRCMIDSHSFVKTLWERIRHLVPDTWDSKPVIGINERLRILRYYPGDEFKPHVDGHYVSPEGNHSQITLLIYLNEDYKGAFTSYLSSNNHSWIQIVPKTGMVVLQDQSLLHYVPALQEGCKYAIRTEIMYKI
jgi:hypothetical protein